jgi:hypothetical protein
MDAFIHPEGDVFTFVLLVYDLFNRACALTPPKWCILLDIEKGSLNSTHGCNIP